MKIKTLVFCSLFALSPLTVQADGTQNCNQTQITKCTGFCSTHNGMQSCLVDMTTKSGTCTCSDGTSHSKQK